MIHKYHRRGSVLLMVVGLLTIIAMLGSTFIFISYLDARQHEAMSERNNVDPIARGILSKLRMEMASDTHLGSNSGAPWGDFVDFYPREQTIPADGGEYDEWLRRDVAQTTGKDTNDDGFPDDELQPTGITSPTGLQYYSGYNVIDLSSLICVNTAGKATEPTSPISPANVDLFWLLNEDTDVYSELHAERCGNLESDLGNFYTQSGSRLMRPDPPGYQPFSIGEEVYLRVPDVAVGRLASLGDYKDDPAIYKIPGGLHKYLTTLSQSSSRLREQASGTGGRISFSDLADTGDDKARQTLYRILSEEIDIDDNHAGSFVANLYSFLNERDVSKISDDVFAFEPEESTLVYYAAFPQPVITEFYAYTLGDDTDTTDVTESGRAIAIELFNPFGGDDIDLSDYHLVCGGSDEPFPVTEIASGERIVFYAVDGFAPDGEDWKDADPADFGFDTGAGWHSVPALLNFVEAEELTIEREVNIGEDQKRIAIDQVTSDNVTVSEPEPSPNGTINIVTCMKDDHPDRHRLFLTKMTNIPSHNVGDITSHTLGVENGLEAGDIEGDVWGFEVYLPETETTDIGSLSDILFVGSQSDGKSLTQALTAIADDATLAKTRGKACPLYTPLATGDYPEVPWASLLPEIIEMLPTDPVAGRESRVYGRVNINTASQEVLMALLPKQFPGTATDMTPEERLCAAKYIIAYRDMTSVIDEKEQDTDPDVIRKSYEDRATALGVTGFRANSSLPCFLTPGEIAIPLADFTIESIEGYTHTNVLQDPALVRDTRDAIYRHMSNLITVNSDVFCANITIQLKDDVKNTVEGEWHYIAVLDRGNVSDPDHLPAVLMFTEVK